MAYTISTPHPPGDQRLSIEALQKWEAAGYGMFLHFGMSTFSGDEMPTGNEPSSLYAPTKLDVDQWVSVARDAGMKYAILTAKHVSGHCLWPSKHTDYHVGTSGNPTDVVEAFFKACEKRGVAPALYYCSWDNHHKFGSMTPTDYMARHGKSLEDPWEEGEFCEFWYPQSYTTQQYRDFQTAQLEELLTGYGKLFEVFIDIPGVLPRDYRDFLYRQIAEWQPEAVIVANSGIGDGFHYRVDYAWPSDLIAIERFVPNGHSGHAKWRKIEGKHYYVPGEVYDPVGKHWFHMEDDQPRSPEELLGMYLISRSRGTNVCLDVGPDKEGRVPQRFVDALMRLRKDLDKLAVG